MERKKTDDLKVFISHRESICGECHENLGSKAWITLDRAKGALCLSCADLDHLVYLPAGDMALTVRSKKYSRLSAVVLKFSRARRRYERQGLLVEADALGKAEEECLADTEVRERRRQREADRRLELDREYVEQFANRIRELYPGCPPKREVVIAEHACLKYSGRIGRAESAKNFEENAVRIAVEAHIRHAETEYDELLMRGSERWEARDEVHFKVQEILDLWSAPTH
ncbi:DUF2293 domain-containing protein [bacterium]|nr:DUF2293 domain-containing protein [bacterium]